MSDSGSSSSGSTGSIIAFRTRRLPIVSIAALESVSSSDFDLIIVAKILPLSRPSLSAIGEGFGIDDMTCDRRFSAIQPHVGECRIRSRSCLSLTMKLRVSSLSKKSFFGLAGSLAWYRLFRIRSLGESGEEKVLSLKLGSAAIES